MRSRVLWLPLFVTMICWGCAAGPSREIVAASDGFTAVLADDRWDGNNLPPGEQCLRFGGKNASAPALAINGIPQEANVLERTNVDLAVY